MEGDNTEKIYFDNCDKNAIAIYYPNHLKLQKHSKKLYERQRLNNSSSNYFQIFL